MSGSGITAKPCIELPPDGLLVGIEQFNRGDFFECHETLEDLWMAEARPFREFYQGILQIGVAFHHLNAGRYRPVVTLLVRGTKYLQPFAPVCMGINVADLLANASACLVEVERLGPDRLSKFDHTLIPRVEMTT
jgi:predicted metal-dependent hydrolase